jgi:hypothetical protein
MNPDCAVADDSEREAQAFCSEAKPFGIAMANLKFQNMESAIRDLKFRVLARARYAMLMPRLL